VAFDWLLGPKRVRDVATESVTLRSYTIDTDTFLDIAAALDRDLDGPAASVILDMPLAPVTIAPVDVPGLSPADRRRVYLNKQGTVGGHAAGGIGLAFYPGAVSVMCSGPFTAERDTIVQIIEDNGTPRIPWKLQLRLLPKAATALVIAAWVWAELSTPLHLALHVFGWLLVALAVTAIALYARSKPVTNYAPGHLIRMESRADTAARRADVRKDLRVAGITAPITLAGGFVLALLLGILDL